SIATEFVCVNYYLEAGNRKLAILGQLNSLIEAIYETEVAQSLAPSPLQIHGYSFGTIIAIDALFPFGNPPAEKVTDNTETLYTIGCPYEFISSYYPGYFDNRNGSVGKRMKWFNIFTNSDALSSNFRKDDKSGPAEYSFGNNKDIPSPENLAYEIIPKKKFRLFDFAMLYFLRAHDLYWDGADTFESCASLIFRKVINYDSIHPGVLQSLEEVPMNGH
ncbi:MAG: hypothetical protein C5B59_10060, partial [Bacteroidetes bacterium]